MDRIGVSAERHILAAVGMAALCRDAPKWRFMEKNDDEQDSMAQPSLPVLNSLPLGSVAFAAPVGVLIVEHGPIVGKEDVASAFEIPIEIPPSFGIKTHGSRIPVLNARVLGCATLPLLDF